jgi:hypothetical protein
METLKGKRPIRRSRHRWEDNIKMDLKELGLGFMNWIYLAQGMNQWRAPVKTVMDFRVQ